MEKTRFVETGSSSFFGEYLYDQVVPAHHFLRQLKQIIKWERFTQKLIRLYKGGGVVGRPPFDPALVLKMELIAYLYNQTEGQVGAVALDHAHGDDAYTGGIHDDGEFIGGEVFPLHRVLLMTLEGLHKV